MKNFLKFGFAAAIVLSAGAANAQTGAGTDVSGFTPGAIVTFAPLPTTGGSGELAGGGGAAGVNGATAINGVGNSFTSGGSITSPATNAPIPAGALNTVGQVITTGSPAAVAALINSLTAAGAPAGATATLVQALAALAGATPGTAPNLIISAAQAFNAFVAAAPASFFTAGTLPPQFLAVHAALTPMVAAIR